MKMKWFGLIETKLFLFHRILKKGVWGQEGGSSKPHEPPLDPPLITFSHVGVTVGFLNAGATRPGVLYLQSKYGIARTSVGMVKMRLPYTSAWKREVFLEMLFRWKMLHLINCP